MLYPYLTKMRRCETPQLCWVHASRTLAIKVPFVMKLHPPLQASLNNYKIKVNPNKAIYNFILLDQRTRNISYSKINFPLCLSSLLVWSYHILKIPSHLQSRYVTDCELFSGIYLAFCLESKCFVRKHRMGAVWLARVGHEAECWKDCLTTSIGTGKCICPE